MTITALSNIDHTQITSILAKTSFFSSIEPSVLSSLVEQCEIFLLEAGSILINEHEEGDSLHFVISGQLRAIKNYNKEEETILSDMGQNELIGELALLTGKPRAATVIAIRDSVILKLTKTVFLEFVKTHPLQLLDITKESLLRVLSPPPQRKKTLVTFAIMPAGQENHHPHFAIKLSAEMARIGATIHLNSTNLAAHLQCDTKDLTLENNLSLTQWFSELERSYDYVIYETDATCTAWTKLCLRQADQIVSVAFAGENPSLNSIEQFIYSQEEKVQKNVNLVLVQDKQTLNPAHTIDWLKIRKVQLHHHIKEGSSTDFARLVRYFTGRSIALVLSGGGARGLAYIGVLKAFKELEIPIDLVAGTSAGAMLGVMIAQNNSCDEMTERLQTNLVKRSIFDYTFPAISVLRGQRWQKNLMNTYGDTYVEDTWLPFFCVSTNITKNEVHIHRTGSVWKSIRASISLPAIVPPVSTAEGDLLIDGGVLNNLPVDLMQNIVRGGTIIAVNVSHRAEIKCDLFSNGEFSGWNLIRQKFNLFKKSLLATPNIAELVFETLALTGTKHDALMAKQADYFISLPIDEFGLFDFKAIDKLIEVGYQHTLKELKDFKAC